MNKKRKGSQGVEMLLILFDNFVLIMNKKINIAFRLFFIILQITLISERKFYIQTFAGWLQNYCISWFFRDSEKKPSLPSFALAHMYTVV